MDVPVAANVLGTLGAICWSVQLIPQIVINYRRHDTTGLQPSMMMLWAWAGIPLGVYNILEDFNIALQIQPQILTFLSLMTWAQCYYYTRQWSPLRALIVLLPIACLMAGIETALILSLRIARSKDVSWPITLMAVLSAVLLAAGVLRHYWDIHTHRTVRGISFIFVSIDAFGDLTSLISVLFEPSLDVLGLVIYGTELILWVGVFAAGGYYNLTPWVREQISKRRTVQTERNQSMDRTNCSIAPGSIVEESNAVTLHAGPSSTSVFRTASASGEGTTVRSRNAIVAIDEP